MIYYNHFLPSIQLRILRKILEIHDYVKTDFIILKWRYEKCLFCIKDTVSAWVSKEQKTDISRLLQQKPDSPDMFLLFWVLGTENWDGIYIICKGRGILKVQKIFQSMNACWSILNQFWKPCVSDLFNMSIGYNLCKMLHFLEYENEAVSWFLSFFFTDFYAVFLNIDLSYTFLIQIRNLQGLD